MTTVYTLVLRLAAEQPGWSNAEIAAEVRRQKPDRRTTAQAVATIKSRAKRQRRGRSPAQLKVWVQGRRLRVLREARGLTRAALAGRAQVSAAQIRRLEAGRRASTSHAVQTKLARALAVAPNVLTGGAPAPVLGDVPNVSRVTVALAPEVRLAFDLLARRYRFLDATGRERGVGLAEVVRVAPLLFALAAEASLAWRKAELADLREALGRAQALAWGSERHRFARDVAAALRASAHEEQATERRDLFGDPLPADHRHQPEGDVVNPFADYLRSLLRDADQDVARLADGFEWPFPAYRLCEGDLRRITGGSPLAAAALAAGDVRLGDLPPQLLAPETIDETAGERVRWIEARASANTRKLARQRFALGE